MKTMNQSNSPRRLPVALAAALATLLASPVSTVFAQSFPQYPLQTGGGVAEPNIMFILDDSGSMANEVMASPDVSQICRRQGQNCASPRNDITDLSYVGNIVHYNPSTTYKPWLTASGSQTSGGTSFDAVYGSFNIAGPGFANGESDTVDLGNSGSCQTYSYGPIAEDNPLRSPDTQVCGGVQVFHVPKDPTSTSLIYLRNSANYYRYELHRVNGTLYTVRSELQSNGGLGALIPTSPPVSTTYTASTNSNNNRNFTLLAGGTISVTTSGGTGNARLRIFNPANNSVCNSNNNGNVESCTVTPTAAGNYRVELYNTFANVNVIVEVSAPQVRIGCGTTSGWAWGNCTLDALPNASRNKAEEFVNYSTWFSYHRTGMKAAKAGATEAFNDLGDNVRVGYRSIWNRSNLAIPVNDGNSGLFEGSARQNWFSSLLGAKGDGYTPLRGALQSTGEYFSDNTSANNPYGPETGEDMLACRQNFAILTTDGYWRTEQEYFDGGDVGDQDGTAGVNLTNPKTGVTVNSYAVDHPFRDGSTNRLDTLADVAMKYWKNDLVDLENYVPTSQSNPAFWQHMVTFGISIGLKGTVDQTSVAQVMDDGRPRVGGNAVDWPNPMTTTVDARRIDDLLHAAVNGRGEFIAATNAEAFSQALTSVLGKIQARLASGSNVATNSTTFQDDTRMYQATYYSELWDGDLTAFDVTALGGISPTAAWSVSDEAKDAGDDFVNRTILTWEGGDGELFPTSTQEDDLARTSGDAPISGANNALYIRGDQTWEMSGGKTSDGFVLRNRVDLIGDIINSSPFYVKESNSIYIGANDGMLHGIDAADGEVLFSYIPAGISMAELATRSDPNYEHRFFVDGPIAVSGFSASPGQNILVGTLGRGGKGAYALDVTDPDDMDEDLVLWDHTGTTDADMGYVLGVPLVLKGNNGDVLAIVPNGIDSENGDSVLYIYNAETGAQLKKLSTGVTSGNGLSSPRAADTNNDGKVDYVYAGDLLGNIWKFDVTDDDPANWAIAHGGLPLFTATTTGGVAQPITGGLALARDEDDTIWISFGTGRLISNGDLEDTSVQTMYGITDGDDVIADRDELTERQIPYFGTSAIVRELPDDEVPEDEQDADEDDITVSVRGFESFSVLPSGSRGWAVDLDNPSGLGERVISGSRIYGSAVWISSVVPSAGEGCEPGGNGWLNALNVFTGTSPEASSGGGSSSFFDLDGDGTGDVVGTGDAATGVGSVNLGVGMPTESRQVDELVLVCGSTGSCASVETPPPPPGTGGEPARLNWRELVEGDE
ncbi:PilC/PilY family type IV pilus protein [Arenimonas sp.]|uniref:PilC/PilY family type IV pilus protein n=1 Tax=Arenimonas sp. TaxID=1872635 RepID=UPI0035B2C769